MLKALFTVSRRNCCWPVLESCSLNIEEWNFWFRNSEVPDFLTTPVGCSICPWLLRTVVVPHLYVILLWFFFYCCSYLFFNVEPSLGFTMWKLKHHIIP